MYTIKDIEASFKEGFSKGIIYNGGVVDEIFKESMDSITKIGSKGKITLEVLVDYVAVKYGVPVDDILYTKSRKRTLIYPRAIITYLAYWFLDESLASIGSYIGDRDHSSISTSVKTLTSEMSVNRSIKSAIQNVVMETLNMGYVYEPNYTRQSGVMRGDFPDWLIYKMV